MSRISLNTTDSLMFRQIIKSLNLPENDYKYSNIQKIKSKYSSSIKDFSDGEREKFISLINEKLIELIDTPLTEEMIDSIINKVKPDGADPPSSSDLDTKLTELAGRLGIRSTGDGSSDSEEREEREQREQREREQRKQKHQEYLARVAKIDYDTRPGGSGSGSSGVAKMAKSFTNSPILKPPAPLDEDDFEEDGKINWDKVAIAKKIYEQNLEKYTNANRKLQAATTVDFNESTEGGSRSRRSARKSRRVVRKSRRVVRKSRRNVRKSKRSVRKSRRNVRKSKRVVRKSRKSVCKTRRNRRNARK